MKLKLILLVIGLSIFNIAVGANMDKEIDLQINYDKEQRNPTLPDYRAFFDIYRLTVEQGNSPEVSPFAITIVKVNTSEVLFKAVSYDSAYSVDLSHIPSGEYRIEIDTELISLLGYFTF